ncbi:hypothetical protein OEZ86_001146 [Tetradesmus obliquus]|nr:hypothetical protein OEZ86_001146 [Tetradesmus obliquus]
MASNAALTPMAVLPGANAYKLLFYPLSERTHMMVHLKLATELAMRNNTVYFMTGDCLQDFAESTARQMAPNASLHFIVYRVDCERHEREKKASQFVNAVSAAKAILANVFTRSDEEVLSNSTLIQQLQQLAPEIDLMVNDILSYGMLLSNLLGKQYIDVDVGTAGILFEPIFYGADPATSYVPAVGTFFPTNGMTFWQRCINLLVTKITRGYVHYAYWHPKLWLQTIIKKHNINMRWPYNHYMMLLTNSNFITEPPRAISPNMKYIGPILPEPAAPLPASLAAWVEQSGPLGTVFVSFGGTLEAPLAASRTLVRVMQSMPDVRFVWKLRREQQADIASEIASLSNVRVSEWVPQNDLLGHPKVRAFVTQGGYLSMAEAAFHAVPVLGMPFIPGQGEQIMFAQDQGRAKRIPADTLMKGDAAGFKAALMDILTYDSYKAAATVISKRLRAVARPYKQVAADWVEYAAAVKDHGPFLNPQKLQQHWYQQAMLDVVLFYAAVLAVPVLLLWRWVHRLRWGFASRGPSSRRGVVSQAAGVVAQVTLAAASPHKKAV